MKYRIIIDNQNFKIEILAPGDEPPWGTPAESIEEFNTLAARNKEIKELRRLFGNC